MDIAKGIPVSVQLETEVTQEGETSNFFFDLKGQLVKIGGTMYLRYKEDALSGEEPPVPVTIKIEPDGNIQIIRSGPIRMRMKFSYQEAIETSYRTPYGLIPLQTFTDNMRISLTDQPFSGKILLNYQLYLDQKKLGDYKLSLTFTV